MQKVSELKEPPIVGKFYLVPMARLQGGDLAPIIGPWHDDADIGIRYKHFHFDVRFIADEKLSTHPRFPREQATMGAIAAIDHSFFDHRITSQYEVVWKRRKCRRAMPEMPKIMLGEIERKHIGRKVLCGKCPHQNFSLESLPQDENGHVICNGHGLKIDMKKGEVIER